MATVLVVDDSAADRELAGRLVKAQGWTVRHAVDGKQALAEMQAHAVGLVLTDLVMPELDGLALVEQVKSTHPGVPIVLMTAKGSEEIAVRALESGAASYVPKKSLVRELAETVTRILSASQEHRSYKRLLTRLRSASFVLENDVELISSLVSYLTQVLRDSELFEEADCHRIATALDEALTNACYHGNLEVRSDVREHDSRAYRELANKRRALEPYRDRRIQVSANLTSGEACFVIKDDGKGFDAGEIPDPTRPENLESAAGRGIFLMRTFMDDVSYNESGNEVTLLKRRPGGRPAHPAWPLRRRSCALDALGVDPTCQFVLAVPADPDGLGLVGVRHTEQGATRACFSTRGTVMQGGTWRNPGKAPISGALQEARRLKPVQ